MKAAEAILIRWRREDPDRLLQAALRQARELAELLPELDGLRSQSAMLRQQLEIQTKRIAQLEEALQGAERAAHRQAAPFRVEPQKRSVAPKRAGEQTRTSGRLRHKPDHVDSTLRSNSVAVHTAVVASSRIPVRSSSSLKTFRPCAPTSHG